METQRKTLFVGRHGVKNGNDIVPESLARLHAFGQTSLYDFVSQYSVTPEQTFVRHSNEIRTLRTAKAITAGAFQIPLEFSTQGVDSLALPVKNILQSQSLCYPSNFKFNAEAIKQEGEAVYVTNWVNSPDAKEYKGVEVTPLKDILIQARRGLENALRGSLREDMKLGILATHAGIVEAYAINAINSAREQVPVENISEIGGPFPMEKGFVIQIDKSQKSGTYNAKLIRDNQEYPIDLNNL